MNTHKNIIIEKLYKKINTLSVISINQPDPNMFSCIDEFIGYFKSKTPEINHHLYIENFDEPKPGIQIINKNKFKYVFTYKADYINYLENISNENVVLSLISSNNIYRIFSYLYPFLDIKKSVMIEDIDLFIEQGLQFNGTEVYYQGKEAELKAVLCNGHTAYYVAKLLKETGSKAKVYYVGELRINKYAFIDGLEYSYPVKVNELDNMIKGELPRKYWGGLGP